MAELERFATFVELAQAMSKKYVEPSRTIQQFLALQSEAREEIITRVLQPVAPTVNGGGVSLDWSALVGVTLESLKPGDVIVFKGVDVGRVEGEAVSEPFTFPPIDATLDVKERMAIAGYQSSMLNAQAAGDYELDAVDLWSEQPDELKDNWRRVVTDMMKELFR